MLAITKIINGGTNGLSHRRAFFERVRQAMHSFYNHRADHARPRAH